MFKNIKLLSAALAVFIIGFHTNSALSMEEGSGGGISIPVSAVKTYFGTTDFMDNFDEEKSTKKQLFDLFILNELIDQKDVVGVCISFQWQATASNGKQ